MSADGDAMPESETDRRSYDVWITGVEAASDVGRTHQRQQGLLRLELALPHIRVQIELAHLLIVSGPVMLD
jgi:hypothetical protein